MSVDMNTRIDIVRHAQRLHMVARAATKDAASGEQWLCKCGAEYRGDGALERGQRHTAQEVLIALDDAAVAS